MKRSPLHRKKPITRRREPESRPPTDPPAPKPAPKPSKPAVLLAAEAIVKARAAGRCERCCRAPDWRGAHVHHRTPRQMGGTRDEAIHSPANLLYLCAACHDWVESHRHAAYEQGFLVHRGTDPATVRVHRPDGTVLRLYESGMVAVGRPLPPVAGD